MLPGDPEQLRHQVPIGRLGQPEEVVELTAAVLRNPYPTMSSPSTTACAPADSNRASGRSPPDVTDLR